MKKTLFALLLCVCLVLTACKAADPDNLFEMPEGSDAGVESSKTDPTESESVSSNAEEVILYTGTYPYGNMQRNVPSGNFMLIGNEVVFQPYREGKQVLFSYDLRTGEVLCFCKDATCEHEDCVATASRNLEAYKGNLYGKTSVGEVTKKRNQPVIIKENRLEVIVDADVMTFFHHEDKLYMQTRDASLVVLGEGKSEPQMVLEEYTGFMHMIFGDYLYANKFEQNIIRIDLTSENPAEEVIVTNAMGLTDGQYIYYVDYQTFKLYRCNMDGSDPQVIDEREVMDGSMNFDDEYFYYRLYTEQKLGGTADSHDIYRFPKEDPTQIEKIATLPVSVWQIFTVPGTGKIFVSTIKSEEENSSAFYILDSDGRNIKMLEIPEY